MTEHEAPKRIWIDPATDLSKLSGHVDNDSVGYIRKDAFIEKAAEWLKENGGCYWMIMTCQQMI